MTYASGDLITRANPDPPIYVIGSEVHQIAYGSSLYEVRFDHHNDYSVAPAFVTRTAVVITNTTKRRKVDIETPEGARLWEELKAALPRQN